MVQTLKLVPVNNENWQVKMDILKISKCCGRETEIA